MRGVVTWPHELGCFLQQLVTGAVGASRCRCPPVPAMLGALGIGTPATPMGGGGALCQTMQPPWRVQALPAGRLAHSPYSGGNTFSQVLPSEPPAAPTP